MDNKDLDLDELEAQLKAHSEFMAEFDRRRKEEEERNRPDTTPFEVLGQFEVKSGKLRVSDPCYDKDTWCAGTIKVKKGKWTGAVRRQDEGDWGVRIKELLVWHESATQEEAEYAYEGVKFQVGVDSGQAGFFDEKLYPQDPHNDDAFYDRVCGMTLGKKSAGLLEFGVVSSSGIGDGSYTCSVAKDTEGNIVAARIDYLPDPGEEWEDDEDYEGGSDAEDEEEDLDDDT